MQPRASYLALLLALSAACSSTRGSPSDAGVIGDSGLSKVPYWQWYYPDCGAPGVCTNPGCSPVTLTVGPVGVCGGPSKEVMTGCAPAPQIVQDDYLYATSEHQLITTEVGAYTLEGLTVCVDDGHLPDQGGGHCCTWLDGGGPTTLMLIEGE